MPSLKSKLPDLFLEAYDLARDDAIMETGINEVTFPKECEWSIEQVFKVPFLPN